jgi:hypothetical protein
LTDPSTLSTSFDPGDMRGEQQRLWAEQPDAAEGKRYLEWVERWDDVLWPPGRSAGAIRLCHEGCGHRLWLVSGSQRGAIWTDARAGDQDLTLGRTGRPLTFMTWYLEWLEHAEATVR